MNEAISCPCGLNKTLSQCCGRFLKGDLQAGTPEELMRSRYTAYCLGGHGRYLAQTWLDAAALGLTPEILSRPSVNWQKLEILHTSLQGDRGEVEFKTVLLKSVQAAAPLGSDGGNREGGQGDGSFFAQLVQ